MPRNNKQNIEKRLAFLHERDGGLSPAAVIEDAKNPASPLHGEFEWDLKKAAYAHWVETARSIIRSVKVRVNHKDDTSTICPAYVRNPKLQNKESGYIKVEDARSELDVAREVLCDEVRRASAAVARARSVAQALGLDAEIDDLIFRLDQLLVQAAPSHSEAAA
ncbi:MAG: hypothetical protein RIC14_05430 [Filomicrobium sp.]